MRIAAVVMLLATGICVFSADAAETEPKQKARPTVTALPRISADLHTALQDRDFEKAVALVDDAIADEKQEDKDYLFYLKGIAQTHLGRFDAAIETFTRLEQDFPKSAWLARSRFGRGAVFARQRNYQQAAAVYKAESERLLSNGRRDELTGIYLEFADRFFEGTPEKGPSTHKQPDFTQALSFYQQALQLKPSREVRQRIELRIARCYQELNQLPQAIEAYRMFLSAYTGRRIAAADRIPASYEVEATFELGRARLAAGQHAEARQRSWWKQNCRSQLSASPHIRHPHSRNCGRTRAGGRGSREISESVPEA